MPSCTTVFNWFRTYPQFLQQYIRAKEEATDALAEEIMDISDDSFDSAINADDPKRANSLVHAHQLRIDTRKWIMSKMKPKKYGDKLDVTTGGDKLPSPIYNGTAIVTDRNSTV